MSQIAGLWLLGVGLALFALAKRVKLGPVRGWGGLAARIGLGGTRSWEITHDEIEPWIAAAYAPTERPSELRHPHGTATAIDTRRYAW